MTYLVAQDAWEITVAVDATGEDDVLLRRVDRSLITLCDRLAELVAIVDPAERRRRLKGACRLCKTIANRLDIVLPRLRSRKLPHARKLVASLASATKGFSVHATRMRAVRAKGPVTIQANDPLVALSTGASAAISSS